MAPIRSALGPRSSSQAKGLPSICSSMPSAGAAQPSPPVHGRGRLGRLAHPSLLEQAIEGRAADDDLLLLRQQLLQVTDVQVVILALRSGQGHDPFHHRRIGAIGRLAAAVAVDHGRHALLAKAGPQPPHLPGAHSQQLGGRRHIQHPGLQAGQNLNFALLFLVQGDCPHTSSMRTFSLSS